MNKSILKAAGAVLATVFFAALIGCDPADSSDPVSYIGAKKPSEAKAVGDVVFNDGSATPLFAIDARDIDSATGVKLTQAEKDAAIAIIFYKGTECSDGENPKERTLGIGLVVDLGKNWCDADAQTGELGIQGTSSYCTTDGTTWGYIFSGKLNGSDNYETLLNNLSDKSTITKFPAICYAHNYSSAATNLKGKYTSGWYLPTIAELYKFGKYYDNNDLSIVVKDFFEDRQYFWPSSTYDSTRVEYGWIEKQNSGTAMGNRQKDGVYTCAIREF